MFRRISVLLLGISILAPGMAAAEDEESIPDPVPRVAVAYDIGFLGDGAYNDAVHRGLELAKKKYKLVEPFVREVPTNGSNSDRLARLRFLCKSGYTAIITIGTGYRDAVKKVSIEFPRVQFALINDKSLGQLNISNVYFNENQAAYIAGVIAGASSKRKSVAIVTSSQSAVEQFTSGAKFAQSKVSVQSLDYTGDALALNSLLGDVDVIYSMWDKDPRVFQATITAPKKIWYIGRTPDQYFSAVKNSQPFLLATINKDLNRPMSELVDAALKKSALIDVLDESGIYGREYNVKTGSITVTFYGSGAAAAKTKVAAALARFRK
jgi:basic membrane protein A